MNIINGMVLRLEMLHYKYNEMLVTFAKMFPLTSMFFEDFGYYNDYHQQTKQANTHSCQLAYCWKVWNCVHWSPGYDCYG